MLKGCISRKFTNSLDSFCIRTIINLYHPCYSTFLFGYNFQSRIGKCVFVPLNVSECSNLYKIICRSYLLSVDVKEMIKRGDTTKKVTKMAKRLDVEPFRRSCVRLCIII